MCNMSSPEADVLQQQKTTPGSENRNLKPDHSRHGLVWWVWTSAATFTLGSTTRKLGSILPGVNASGSWPWFKHRGIDPDHVHPFRTTASHLLMSTSSRIMDPDHLKVVSWTCQWVLWTPMTSTTQDLNPPEQVWDVEVREMSSSWHYVDQNLSGVFSAPCWNCATKN